ncbi:ATP-binding protein [Aeribacillus pallidus]|uniref:ATP-binding protein n=1 Tax=Aeribacillus pallidus TaxID=33936 RepID=UPI003D1B0918
MKTFLEDAVMHNHPIRKLTDFLERERMYEIAGKYDEMRFVGYALEIGYDTVTIITSDPFKIAVGGIPRNSLLIMCPSSFEENNLSITPHFTVLRVLESAPTPLTNETQQTYFELQKKSMPELDVFTQAELQWGALKTGVLGMFYPNPDKENQMEFSGDMNNFVSAHKYKVYAPDDELLDLIVNSIVPKENNFKIGKLRLTECRLPLPGKKQPDVDVIVSTKDFMGARTAMFGKTRLGKSNVVKLIVQSLIETTKESNNVGQLIFDINGEYANDNPQDGNLSIAGAYPDRCVVYALTPKKNTPSRPLKINFYENPQSSKKIIDSLLQEKGKSSNYIESFMSVEIPSIDDINGMKDGGDKIRAIRKLQMYWAILKKANFPINETDLRKIAPYTKNVYGFNPGFKAELRKKAYKHSVHEEEPAQPNSLDALVRELEIIKKFLQDNPNDKALISGDKPYFDSDDKTLLEFLSPKTGSGTDLLKPFIKYHDSRAGDFINEIIEFLDNGKTVILDLGNANEEVMQYFSRRLSQAVFNHQTDKFSNNALGNHFIQLYFEEAHNLFSPNDNDENTKIYRRFAKEGAKYHIGMLYSTQSPTTVNNDLLAQTENFFVAHLASMDDVNKLAKVNVAYESLKEDILNAKTPGYIRMLTRSHRFVISMQAIKFEAKRKEG